MKKIYILCIFLIGITMACVSTVSYKPTTEKAIDFKKYKKIKVAIQDNVNTSYSLERMPMFEGLLKGKLQSMGYHVVDNDENMLLEIRITEFKHGNAAARFFVGFGAGRSLFTYVANFKERDGKLLSTLEGGKSYHGMEVADNPLYKTEEEIIMGMISESVIQIGKFIKNNGELETQKNDQ